MQSIIVNQKQIPVDSDGYLINLFDWDESVAECIARNEGIALTPSHWEILRLLRLFYEQFELSPAMRPLVKFTERHLGKDKGNSIYLLTLFPGSPPKIGAKIAGLPRPVNCL